MKTMNQIRLRQLCQSIQLAFVQGKSTRSQMAQDLGISQQTCGRYVKAPQTMPATKFFQMLELLEIQA